MKTKKKSAKKPSHKLPGFYALCAKTWQELSAFWRPLVGVTAIYALLYFVLVLGFSLAYSYQDIADSIALQIGENASWFSKSSLEIVNLFAYSNQSDAAAAIVQFLLFVIATLAIIWVLRQLRTLKHIKMRDAYFEGTARIVPTTIVIVLLLVPFLPAVIGSAIFSVAQAGAGAEIAIGSIIAGLLLLLTLYWFCAWLPALYIVSLPKGTPIASIRSATKLTKGSRLWMLRNLIFFAFVAVLIAFIVMLLFVLIVPVASVAAAYIVSFVIFAIAQTFIFTTYRGLLDES